MANPYAPERIKKEKPRDRPLSAPSQAAIQGLMSPDHPQGPGPNTPQPQPGPNSAYKPVKLVSVRSSSHSPCRRIDVDIDPELEYLTGFGTMRRNSYSERSHSPIPRRHDLSFSYSHSNFLQIPDNNPFLSPPSDGRSGRLAMRDSPSMPDLSASAPAVLFQQNLRSLFGRSVEYLAERSPCTSPQKTSMRRSSTPTHSSPCSVSPTNFWSSSEYLTDHSPCIAPEDIPMRRPSTPTHSSPCSVSPTNFWGSAEYLAEHSPCPSPQNIPMRRPSIPTRSSPFSGSPTTLSLLSHSQLHLPGKTQYPLLASPACSPRCSPQGSPFGSQTQIGAEC